MRLAWKKYRERPSRAAWRGTAGPLPVNFLSEGTSYAWPGGMMRMLQVYLPCFVTWPERLRQSLFTTSMRVLGSSEFLKRLTGGRDCLLTAASYGTHRTVNRRSSTTGWTSIVFSPGALPNRGPNL